MFKNPKKKEIIIQIKFFKKVSFQNAPHNPPVSPVLNIADLCNFFSFRSKSDNETQSETLRFRRDSQNRHSQRSLSLAARSLSMDINGDCVDLVGNKFPETCFLTRMRRMLSAEEFGEDGPDGPNHKLMVIAVHAVFLESGFVEFVKFRFPNEWSSSMAFTTSFRYTLPEILGHQDQDFPLNLRESVVLKYQILGHSLNVFGSLTSGGPATHRVCLDEHKFAPAIGCVCKRGDEFGREVYEFWKVVMDGLALPLLIDLCAKAALPSPLCFMRRSWSFFPVLILRKLVASARICSTCLATMICGRGSMLRSLEWRLWDHKQ